MQTRSLVLFSALLCSVFSISAQQGSYSAEDLIRQGLTALSIRDMPRAQGLLEQAIEQAPEDARAWVGLANIYRTLNLHTQSHRYAAEAARLGEDNPVIQHALGIFYLDGRNWAEAAKWEEKFSQSEIADSDVFVRTISLYLQADMPLKAIEIGIRGLEKNESAPLNNLLGKAYATAQQPEPALRHLELAITMQPYEESFHYDLGYFHLRQQDFEAADKAFITGQDYFDKSAAIELGLGIAAYGQRRFTDAVDHFLKASRLAPGLEQPHAFLGRLLQHAGQRLDDVEERMRIFNEQYSKSHFGPFLYGQVLQAKLAGDKDSSALEAIESLFRKSIERRGNFWESHYELGVLLEKKGDYQAAQEHLLRAVELNPGSSKPHYRLARVYQRLGKKKEAKQELALHRKLTESERKSMRLSGLPEDLKEAF